MNHWSVTALMLWDFAAESLAQKAVSSHDRQEAAKSLEHHAIAICRGLHREQSWSEWLWWMVRYFEQRLKQLNPEFEELKFTENQ